LSVSQSMVHMQTANSMAMPDRGNGMGLQRAYRAAVGGKHRDSRAGRMAGAPLFIRHLILAAVTLLAVAGFGSSSYAQSGPFSG
jgi:hypothetical protein